MKVVLQWCVIALVLPFGLFAQSSKKPDFSGTWKLDLLRTRFGALPQPKSLVIQIEHHEPQVRILTVTTDGHGETREALDLVTDGQPHAQDALGQGCVATANWDRWSGKKLVVAVTCPAKSYSRQFTVGSKGKMLTTVLTVNDGSVEKKSYEFFSRQ